MVPEQLSEGRGATHVTTAWHDASALTVLSAGQPDKIGGALSTTVTLKEHVAIFPAASLAV